LLTFFLQKSKGKSGKRFCGILVFFEIA